MGNKIARTTQASATEYYLHDLPSSYNLVLKEVLGRGRFFKSIQCKHDEGLVLVKVYFKRGDQIDLREYEKRLFHIRHAFRNLEHPHLWPFQFWLETDKAAYLLRQYFFNNLHERLSTRPFLSIVEKKWLAFQLLCAVKQSHDHGICHGDIKCENVLVTSWNWVYLADFASFKPTYIPDDDPSDFSFFFDTGGRRLCYLAPERFYEHGGDLPVAPDAPLRPSMDIFSVGCVIAELFLESQPLFELSQLLSYRRGQYDPSQHLEKVRSLDAPPIAKKNMFVEDLNPLMTPSNIVEYDYIQENATVVPIPDPGIRKMILHMIQLNPDERLSAEGYLQSYAGVVFPNYFSPFLHNFYSYLNSLDADARVVMCQSAFHEIVKQMTSSKSGDEASVGLRLPANPADTTSQQMVLKQVHSYPKGSSRKDIARRGLAHERLELLGDLGALLRDVDHSNHFSSNKTPHEDTSKFPLLQNQQEYSLQSPSLLHQSISDVFKRREDAFLKKISVNDLKSLMSEYDSESDTYRMPFLQLPPDDVRCEGMVLITSLLCSCIRNVKFPQLRRSCILLLKYSSIYIDDEDRLQRVLPYVIAMLSDSAAIVRCAALETLCDILPLVQEFPPSDAKIFPEYILPMLSMVHDDTEESVRICYASNISKLALTSYGFLVHSIRLSEAGVLDELSAPATSLAPGTDKGQALKLYSNAQLAHLRKSIADVVVELVMGLKQTPNIRRALLQDIAGLCCFFGQRQSNDFLLPILPAFLNDRDEQLRTVFYGQIVYVCFFVGQRSVEEYLLPYIEQALSDTTEGVIVNTLDCLTILCKSGFLRKRVLLEMIQHAFPLLCYPSQWVRRSVASFISASSESLGAVDSYVFLAPVIRPFLRRQPASLTLENALLSCLKAPVSRQVFYQVLENARGSDMLERQRKIWYNASTQPRQWDTVDLPKQDDELLSLKGWPDSNQELRDPIVGGLPLDQVESIECDSTDVKLRALKGYIRNASSTIDVRDHLSSEKLQFSGLITPQLNSMNSFLYDKSSENIPLYSFSLDRRVGNSQAASDTSFQPKALGIDSSSTPWLESLNEPSGMASSVPAPKLVSGSFSIASGSKQFHRVVHEPEARESDQTSYMSSKFQHLGISSSLKGSSSSVEDVSSSKDVTGAPSVSWTSALPDSGWKPRGVLVAHLQEHRSAVNDIAVSTDHSFFVSASDDSTVKVWDSRKLEKDISFRSRLTYPLEGTRALCAAMIRGSAQVVVGACDGRIHMFSVDYISRGLGNVIEKYSGIADVKKKEVGEGPILSIVNYSADASANHAVMYSTQNCGIHLWDTRTNTNSWDLKALPEEGYVSTLVTDPCGNWFVSGSSRGVLTLWDLRFLIPVNSWEYPRPCPIDNICLYVPPPNAPFSVMARPLVYVAAGCNEVSLWNAETGSCHQVFRVPGADSDAELSDLPWALARPPSKLNSKSDPRRNVNLKYRVDELNEPPPRLSGIRALLPLPGGDLLTGGTDLKIRRWDHSRPERSYSVCGPTITGLGNDDIYESKSSFGVQVVQETRRRPLTTKLTSKAVLTAAATDPAGCHRDSILALASVKLNQRLLLSSSRDGAIKVWK